MPRLKHTIDGEDDSDSSFSPHDSNLFDSADEDEDSGTEVTDIELCDNPDEGNEDGAAENLAALFDGNAHPPEYYRQGIEEFDEDDLDDGYAPGTREQLDSLEDEWRRFCTSILRSDAKTCFRSVTAATLYKFFDWRLNQKIGKAGRKKKGTKKESSLETGWKQFRLVYERAMGEKLDSKLGRRMRKPLKDLAKKHELSRQRRKNRCMTIDQLKGQIEETLSTTEKSFELGEIRILAVLFLLLLAPEGARPTSILRLRFGDIRIMLVRDPEGGPPIIASRFTLEFTKTYLGDKDANTFTVPEAIFDPSLLLSPHIFLLGVLFRHHAFRAPNLVCPAQLDNLKIHPGELELPVPLRKDLDDVCIFRRAIKTLTGYELSPTEAITYGMMASWIKTVGEILGLETGPILYSLRYNAANEFDQSANVSDALRNLMLGHASSDPFRKHYLGREINVDTWAILRGRTPQQALLKQICSVGHSISKRRPLHLTPAQSASIDAHPLVKKLTERLPRLQPGSPRYAKTRRELRNTKQTLKRTRRQQVRAEWTESQAVEDIERQLQGAGFAEFVRIERSRPQLPAQKRLLAALTAPVETTLEGYYRRRDNAIEAIAAYCQVQEGQSARRAAHSTTRGAGDASMGAPTRTRACSSVCKPSEETPALLAAMSVFVEDAKERPKRCFLCVGEALSREPDDPSVQALIREFYTSSDLTKHFQRRHLNQLSPGVKPVCLVCSLNLSNKKHLQTHALLVHGTRSREE